MMLIVSDVLKKYTIRYEGEAVQMSPMITLRSKGDINLTFEKR